MSIGRGSSMRGSAPAGPKIDRKVKIVAVHYPFYQYVKNPANQWHPLKSTICLIDFAVYTNGERYGTIFRNGRVVESKEGKLMLFPPTAPNPWSEGDDDKEVEQWTLNFETRDAVMLELTEGDDPLDDAKLDEILQHWLQNVAKDNPEVLEVYNEARAEAGQAPVSVGGKKKPKPAPEPAAEDDEDNTPVAPASPRRGGAAAATSKTKTKPAPAPVADEDDEEDPFAE